MKLAPAYAGNTAFDELLEPDGGPRHAAVGGRLMAMPEEDLLRRQQAAAARLQEMGITFAVYGHGDGTEKVWPFDIVPRVIAATEWAEVERGLRQRIRALNLFLDDVYTDRKILRDGVVPEELVLTSATYRPELCSVRPPQNVWTHIVGTDLVRDQDGRIYVLEDNLRCPSGVSYVLENREVMKRVLPEAFHGSAVQPVEEYPEKLLETLLSSASDEVQGPTAVLLTPGSYNSAYFEHCFLAQQMGIELVTGPDLFVDNGLVFMKTTRGPERVDVIYRRIDDDFLDPKCFRSDSVIGVPGLMEVYRAGRVALANAPGTGIADDKAIYAFVPEIIRYYLAEEAILNNVPTFICSVPEQCQHVLSRMHEMVVKPVNESGGYGILMGPQASEQERAACADAIRANPRNFIAQPMLCLSTVPTITPQGLAPRHVDLRPFILYGRSIYVLPGGLTRVALREGSMVVNSSQGGGSKDTWVLSNGPVH